MTALIIPAYKPDEKLLDLVERYRGSVEYALIVIDDGSGPEFQPIFERLPEWVIVLRHSVNRGKGAALKTAMAYILQSMPQCDIAVTADADGQHTQIDIDRVTAAARENAHGLTMGCRAFKGKVPPRSLIGNGITRGVFALVSRTDVSDTQTGLRAFGRSAMERFSTLKGDRYEYEINMLLDAAANMPVAEVPIETIYIEENASSHFNPLKDSIRIYSQILRFILPELIGFILSLIVLGVLMALPISNPAWALLLATLLSGAAGIAMAVACRHRAFPRGIADWIAVVGELLVRYAGLLGLVCGLGVAPVWAGILLGLFSRIAQLRSAEKGKR